METLLKILEGCENLFMRYGIKSVTMDDVARELGISKKTLYQYVTDKNDLVDKTLEYYLGRHTKICNSISHADNNPIENMLGIGEFVCQQLGDTNPALMFDLRKYHPAAWHMLDQYRLKFIAAQIEENLQRGIEMGYYRADLPINIVPRMYLSMVDAVLDGPYYPRDQFKFENVVKEILNYHLHAICTPKGIDYLNTKITTK